MTGPASADMSRRMTNYLIVVPRGNSELFELLSVAFRGHTAFHVVIDRRGSDAPAVSVSSPAGLSSQSDGVSRAPAPDVNADRRGGGLLLGPDEIVVAERADRADCPGSGAEPRAYRHLPVRRRRAGRSTARTSSARSAGPIGVVTRSHYPLTY